MTPDDVRKLAVCLPFADADAGLNKTQAALMALADLAQAAIRACRNDDDLRADDPLFKALALLEALQ